MQLSDFYPGMTVTLKSAEELRSLSYVVRNMVQYAGQTFEVKEVAGYSIILKGMDSWSWGADAFVDESDTPMPEITEDILMELIGNG